MVEAQLKESLFYERKDSQVRCNLCPHYCLIKPNQTGVCGIRKNIDGHLYSLIYSRPTSIAVDPIEKKPLYHFYPGKLILSLGTLGCNFSCPFCQNWTISQTAGNYPTIREMEKITKYFTPQEAVDTALRCEDNIGIAYTYNEPFIWYEYVLETSILAKEKKLHNILVTNGSVNEEPLKKILPYIDAMNIDLKSIRPEFYRKICKSDIKATLNTIILAVKHCHVEITNLLIPTLNDKPEEIEALVDWIFANCGERVPLHFSRYHPSYKLNIPSTPVETLERAREIALKKLKYVYIGNVWHTDAEDTYCPSCGKKLVIRKGFQIVQYHLNGHKRCKYCQSPVDIIF